jgi:hypothetical protein
MAGCIAAELCRPAGLLVSTHQRCLTAASAAPHESTAGAVGTAAAAVFAAAAHRGESGALR